MHRKNLLNSVDLNRGDDSADNILLQLPLELFFMILNFLDLKSLARLSQTQKIMASLIGNERTNFDLIEFGETDYYVRKLLNNNISKPQSTDYRPTFFQLSHIMNGAHITRDSYNETKKIEQQLSSCLNYWSYHYYLLIKENKKQSSFFTAVCLFLLEISLYACSNPKSKDLVFHNSEILIPIALLYFIFAVQWATIHVAQTAFTQPGERIAQRISEQQNRTRALNGVHVYDIRPHKSDERETGKLKRP